MRSKVLLAEKMLAINWDLIQKEPWKDTPKAYNVMGRCMTRMGLHLCKKEAKGRDTKQWDDLAAISIWFAEEVAEAQNG